MTDKSLDVAMYNTRGMTSFMSNFHEVIGYNPETKELWGRNGIRWREFDINISFSQPKQ